MRKKPNFSPLPAVRSETDWGRTSVDSTRMGAGGGQRETNRLMVVGRSHHRRKRELSPNRKLKNSLKIVRESDNAGRRRRWKGKMRKEVTFFDSPRPILRELSVILSFRDKRRGVGATGLKPRLLPQGRWIC